MAGIGLYLKQLVSANSYTYAAAGYMTGAVIYAGPWLTSVIALAVLRNATGFLPAEDQLLLFASITYVFCVSLIATGAMQMVLTRFLADRLYNSELESIAPTLTAALPVCAGVLIVFIAPFVVFAQLELSFKFLTAGLFLVVSLTWLVMTFLSACKSYAHIVLGFLVGYALSLASGVWLGREFGVEGTLAGFIWGQVVALYLLTNRVYTEFPSPKLIDLRFLSESRRFWELALIGLLFNFGVWADKIIYWFTPEGVIAGGFLRVFPAYDTSTFVAYMLTIPASTVFLIHIETQFYRHYREFFLRIKQKAPLNRILESQSGMSETARSGLITLIKIQGLVSIAAILAAEDLAALLSLGPDKVGMLRTAVMGASAQQVLLAGTLLLLYLDARRAALYTSILFALTSVLITSTDLIFPPVSHGVGYVIGATAASIAALLLGRYHLRNLSFVTFMAQPVSGNRR